MIEMYFGSPGCGKTTTACYLLSKRRKAYKQTYANFSCGVCDIDNVDLTGLGDWTFPEHSFICVDESGIEYNSRSYKTFPKSAIRWYKKHRHHKCDVAFFSQSWEDTDKIIRNLCDRLFYCTKFACFTLVRRVYKRVKVDKNTEQIIDGYKMCSLLFLLLYPFKPVLKYFIPTLNDLIVIFRPRYYKYFNTYESENLPVKYEIVKPS